MKYLRVYRCLDAVEREEVLWVIFVTLSNNTMRGISRELLDCQNKNQAEAGQGLILTFCIPPSSMAFLQRGIMAPMERSPATATSDEPRFSSFFSQRARRQLGLFFAGAGFVALSTIVTRRALVRRYRATVPKFYQQSNQPNKITNGYMEALEALNLATVNVLSYAMMLTGGVLYAFDISSLDDMRRNVRSKMGNGDGAQVNDEEEKEIEKFFVDILEKTGRKFDKDGKEIKTAKQAEDTEEKK